MIKPTPQGTRALENAPVFAPGARSAPGAAAIYEGFKAQRSELRNQLEDLQGTRQSIAGQLEELSSTAPERKPLEARLTDVDQRIVTVDGQIATNATQIAQAAAIPGAVVEPPPYVQRGPPEEAWVAGGFFLVLVIFPLTIAYARRIWRRGVVTVSAFPKELSDRLFRMEHAVEATSLEVERIGEGQRFLTKLFTEGDGARALGAGAAQPIEQKKAMKSAERLP
ncbi:MAG: hypothetical protein ACR2NS_15160 [Gemmatimonadaceae bacterium]